MSNSVIASTLFSALLLSTLASTGAHAVEYTFAPITDPLATAGGEARGINASGQIVGVYNDSAGTHGFVDTNNVFTTIDAPNAIRTYAYGINDSGQVAGFYQDTNGLNHGFVDTNGTFTTIDIANSQPGSTIANGINNAGQVIGNYQDDTGSHGYLLDAGGNFTPIDDPSGITQSYDGTFDSYTRIYGLNNAGDIVGTYEDASYNQHGFLLSNGLYSDIDDPLNPTSTQAVGINDQGQIVGFSYAGGFTMAADGTFTPLNSPAAGTPGTTPTGVNDVGQVVGYTTENDPENHLEQGFIATVASGQPAPATDVPELTSLALLASLLLGLGTLTRFRRA